MGRGAPGHGLLPEVLDAVGLLTGVAQLDAGFVHACAVRMSGAALCWGLNNDAQLGAYRPDDHTPRVVRHRRTPTLVPGLSSGIESIGAGGDHSCAVTTSGEILCWGRNDFGQLGNRDPNNSRAQPRYVIDLGATATRTMIQSNRRPSRAGQIVIYTARVTPATSTGRVRFGDGQMGDHALLQRPGRQRVARCRIRYRNPGLHRIRAWYLGTQRMAPSSSGLLRQRVNP